MVKVIGVRGQGSGVRDQGSGIRDQESEMDNDIVIYGKLAEEMRKNVGIV
jgi:hypothetical protein